MEYNLSLATIPDHDLLDRLTALLRDSRRTEADLVVHIGEVDRRGLYAREACSSMFIYCTEVLHLSEHEAYFRITVARAAREHPELLAMLADGRLHLTGIAKLAPHLTAENRSLLLRRATHRSKQQIEELLAELFPQPDAPAVIRRLPRRDVQRPALTGDSPGCGRGSAEGSAGRAPLSGELGPDRVRLPPAAAPGPSGAVTSPGPSGAVAGAGRSGAVAGALTRTSAADSRVEAIAPARYRVQFTASAELRDKLERLRDLMRPSVPDGDLAAIIGAAVSETLQRLEARRFARTDAPRSRLAEVRTREGGGVSATSPNPRYAPNSRHVPAAVRRAVHERDGGRCRYVDDHGRRCSARRRLEYHHRFPYGRGGEHSVENICLMCHTHNRLAAEADYGRAAASCGQTDAPRGAARPALGGVQSPACREVASLACREVASLASGGTAVLAPRGMASPVAPGDTANPGAGATAGSAASAPP